MKYIGAHAESIMQQRSNQHNEEFHELRRQAEAYLIVQNEDISRLRHELADANSEMQRSQMGMEVNVRNERNIAHANEVLSSELLMSKTKLQQNEAETSILHNTLENRSNILNSEIANLHSVIESQRNQQIMRSGFTEEIKSYLLKKLSEYRNEYQQERLTLQSMAQSEGDVAKLYKSRYEDITREIPGSESNPDSMVKALKIRLDKEKEYNLQQVSIRHKETDELMELKMEMNAQKHENQKNKVVEDRLRRRMEEENNIRMRLDEMHHESKNEIHDKDERIAFLESETDRLREDRNEHWAYSQQLYEELWENKNERQPEEEENAEETAESAKAGSSENKSRISPREADKLVAPPWPKSHDLEGWKSQLISNVLSACADTDQESWICWLGEAFRMNPDLTALGDSGGPRFTTIDVNALNSMITSSGDSGKEVGMEIKVMTLDLARRDPPGIIKGRQVIAMIMDSFRSSTHTDLAFTGKHLYEMTYPGDNKLSLFKTQWIHILSAMREDDKPRGLALRDILYDKIKGSSLMAFDIQYYRKKPEGHPEKTYEYLMEMMTRTISTEREEKNRLEKSKGIQQIMGAKALAAEKTGKETTKPDKNPKGHVDNTAAPVVAKAPPKTRPEPGKGKGKDGKGKGKGKGKDRSRERSPSVDRKKIPCVFHFQKGGCSKGKECQFSDSKRSLPRGSSNGPGKGKGDGKARTPSPKPKSEKPCFLFAKGKCERADCPYKHDSNAAPAEDSSAKAKASPKGKAKAAAAKAKSAAVVVEMKRSDNNDYLSHWSDADDLSPIAAGKMIRRRAVSLVRKDKVVKIKRNPEKIHIDVGFNTKGLPKRQRARDREPRYVKKEFLESESFKHQAIVNHLIARARAKVLNNDIHGKRPEAKVKIGKDMYVEVKWKGNQVIESMIKMGKRSIIENKVPCALPGTTGKSVRFIMDTGWGHDLISQRKVKELGSETILDNDGMTFMTANGLTDSNETTVMDHEGLGQCKLHVLNQTPAVLSIGSRCTKEGYSFIWRKVKTSNPS